ncbi:MAG: glycosyltransferase family 2 protein [Thermodesulfobacteriota bacterium]
MKPNEIDFSVVIPTYFEEQTIGIVMDEVNELKNDHHMEVIVVDDNSRDKTRQIAEGKGARVLINPNRKGKGSSLLYGFSKSRGRYLVMMDGDGSHRAIDTPKLLEVLKTEPEVGLVIASRIMGGSDEYTPIKALGNVFLTYFTGLFLKRYLSDAINGFKAFRREIFDCSQFDSYSFDLEIELIANTMRRGFQIREVASHERARLAGEAKAKIIQHGTQFFLRIFKEYLKNKRLNANPASA